MARSRWIALLLVVLGIALLLVARLFLPLTDAELTPTKVADYVRPISAAVSGFVGLAFVLIGATKLVRTNN